MPEDDIKLKEMVDKLDGLIAAKVEEKVAALAAKQTPLNGLDRIKDVKDVEQKQWDGLGDYAKAVALKALGRYSDPRLTKAPSGLNTLVPSEGGLAVPEELSLAQLNTVLNDPTILSSRCSRIDGVKGTLRLVLASDEDRSGGTVYGGVRVYRVKEGEQLTSSKLGLRSVSFTPKPIHALMYITDELLDQTGTVLNQLINSAMIEALEYNFNREIMEGKVADGEFMGITNSPAAITVTKETGQSDEKIIAENISNMLIRTRPSWRPFSNFVFNPDAERWLRHMTIGTSGDGQPVWFPQGGFAGKSFSTIDGTEVVYSEHCPIPGDAGAAMLVNFKQYMIVTGGPAKTAASMEFRFDYAEQAIRMTIYADGKPLLNTPYKPPKGSTKSSIVMLGAVA